MAESKIKQDKNIRNNTGAILNPGACGTKPTKNFLSVGFGEGGICEYPVIIEDSDTGTGEYVNQAPIVDLNGLSAGSNASGTFVEGNPATTYVTSATITDADDTVLESITIIGVDGFGEDSANDIVKFSSELFPSNVDKSATMSVAGTTLYVVFTTIDKKFVITNNTGGTIPISSAQSFIRLFSYYNTASPPDTSTRRFTFSVNDGTNDSAVSTLTITVAIAGIGPTIDLDTDTVGINYSTLWNNESVLAANSSSVSSDTELSQLTMVLGGLLDESQESITISGVQFLSNADKSSVVNNGIIPFLVDYTASTKTFVITSFESDTFSAADAELLIDRISYNNIAP